MQEAGIPFCGMQRLMVLLPVPTPGPLATGTRCRFLKVPNMIRFPQQCSLPSCTKHQPRGARGSAAACSGNDTACCRAHQGDSYEFADSSYGILNEHCNTCKSKRKRNSCLSLYPRVNSPGHNGI